MERKGKQSEKRVLSLSSDFVDRFEFEVFGKVQGVWFRKYTSRRAKQLHLHGWVRNTPHRTVAGVVEGEVHNLAEMKTWLSSTGSPQSRIDKLEVKSEVHNTQPMYHSFNIRK